MNALIANIIIILILAVCLTAACLYIYKEKKKGKACIGCPYADSCPKHRQNGTAGCGSAGQYISNHN